MVTLQWRHNGHHSVSNHQPHDCLLNLLFRRRSKKTSKLRVTGLCVGNSPGTGEFPAQMASNAENVSIWWRHHDLAGVRAERDLFCLERLSRNKPQSCQHGDSWWPVGRLSPGHQHPPCWPVPWWRHQMETFSALLALCAGNSPVSGEFPAQRPMTRSFDVFFDLHLIKRLSKHSWGWWFETLSRPLWRHCHAAWWCWGS